MSPRPIFNALLTPPWTALMTTLGVAAVSITRQPPIFRRLERVWARGLTRMWGVEVIVHGRQHIDLAATQIIMCNHQSLVDIPVLFSSLPLVPGFMAKQELAGVPVLATAMREGGHILIHRGDARSTLGMLKQAAAEIRSGKTIALFPEGTRHGSEVVGPFKKGGFVLAKRAAVPVVPVGIRGSGRVLPKGGFGVRPGHIEVHIGPPIPGEEVARIKVETLMDRVRAEIVALSGMPAIPEGLASATQGDLDEGEPVRGRGDARLSSLAGMK